MKIHLRKHELSAESACGDPMRRRTDKALPEDEFASSNESKCTKCANILTERIQKRIHGKP